MTAIHALYLVLCAALMWSCFCRATRMHKGNTRRDVRWAFQLLTVAAAFALAAPLLWAYRPDWVVTLLLAGMVAVQWATAHYWRHGVPEHFQRQHSEGTHDHVRPGV